MLRRIAISTCWIPLGLVIACSGAPGTPADSSVGGSMASPTSGGTGSPSTGSTLVQGGGSALGGTGNQTTGVPSGGASTQGGKTNALGSSSGGVGPSGGANGQGGLTQSGSANSGGTSRVTTSSTGGKAPSGGSGGQGGALMGGATATRSNTSSGGRTSSVSTSIGGATTSSPSTTGGTASGGAATGGTPGSCDPGSSTTAWASNCPTSGASCTSGTWTAGGPDPDQSGFKLCSESTHFAVYSDEACTASAQTAVTHLETVWELYFGNPLYMKEPLCNSATKYKASVHVHSDWGLTGGSWASNRMGMWIGTGGLSDHWGLAHEFMHGVQAVSGGQSCNSSNTCGWIYESHANWAAQQQTEYHTKDVHCSEMLANMPHLYLGSTRDRYCNWQFMEYLKDKYCYSAVNAIWTGSAAADPFTSIRNNLGWTVAQLNDFMGEWAMHNVTWDYQDPAPSSTSGQNQGGLFRAKYGVVTDTSQVVRRLRLTKVEPLDADFANNRRFFSPFYWAPQRYGYNVIRLYPESGSSSVTVTFRGVTSAASSPDWRWGLVATDSAMTKARYSGLQKGSDGSLTYCVNSGESLFLVVTATPSAWYNIVWDQAYNTVPRYPYLFELTGAWPQGFQNGSADACPSGLVRASNGGGCAPSGTGAYVGPYATVLTGATVGSGARIEDHATVASGTVSNGTVGAMTIISGLNMSSGTAKTTFYPLGFFESGQGLSGATLMGDVEYRGTGYNRASGTCSGFVDSATCVAPGTDATPAPPYAWR